LHGNNESNRRARRQFETTIFASGFSNSLLPTAHRLVDLAWAIPMVTAHPPRASIRQFDAKHSNSSQAPGDIRR
jgi:hypothetical protein